MNQQAPKKRGTIEFLLTFLILFLLAQWGLRFFFPEQFGDAGSRPPVEVGADDVRAGHHPVITIRNNTDLPLTLVERCPQPPVDVVFLGSGTGSGAELIADETVLPCAYPTSVPAHASVTVDLGPWKYSLFGELGTYRVTLDRERADIQGMDHDPSATFEIKDVGSITRVFRSFVTKPLLNALIFIADHTPGHDLGLAVIVLTLLIKLLLFFPSQHALEGQRKLQELQPKLDEIRTKYKDDPRKQQEETLKVWKQHRINPLQSCLPLLLQFPVLIGLFFTVKDGAVLELSRHLLYPTYQNLPWTFDTMFLGLDLTQPSRFILPPLLVILQFVQMKMTLLRKKAKQTAKGVVDVGEKKKWSLENIDQQTVMLYVLPVMIGVFAYQFPAAVSLYWGVSTLFAIGQQWWVNRKK